MVSQYCSKCCSNGVTMLQQCCHNNCCNIVGILKYNMPQLHYSAIIKGEQCWSFIVVTILRQWSHNFEATLTECCENVVAMLLKCWANIETMMSCCCQNIVKILEQDMLQQRVEEEMLSQHRNYFDSILWQCCSNDFGALKRHRHNIETMLKQCCRDIDSILK